MSAITKSLQQLNRLVCSPYTQQNVSQSLPRLSPLGSFDSVHYTVCMYVCAYHAMICGEYLLPAHAFPEYEHLQLKCSAMPAFQLIHPALKKIYDVLSHQYMIQPSHPLSLLQLLGFGFYSGIIYVCDGTIFFKLPISFFLFYLFFGSLASSLLLGCAFLTTCVRGDSGVAVRVSERSEINYMYSISKM